jgi:hypothetical protein
MQEVTGMSRAPRVVLGIILVGFVAQLVVAHYWGEPYPGVFQPRFSAVAAGGTAVALEPTVAVTYSDDSTATFNHLDVMAESQALPLAVFRTAFSPNSPSRESDETVSWLQHRLSALHDGIAPRRAVIEWHKVTYWLDDHKPPKTERADRLVITFGGKRD